VNSYESRFEREVRKLIAEERTRVLEVLESGLAVTDYSKYQNYTGRLAALRQVTETFFPEVQKIINEG
jgi:hypothetical protein